MSEVYVPEGYVTKLPVYETQRAIELIKQSFQKNLCAALNLKRVSAPLFVSKESGLNDDLNGVARPFPTQPISTERNSTVPSGTEPQPP